jgi:hypothetical protein
MNDYSTCTTLVTEQAMVCEYEISHLRFRNSSTFQIFFDVFRSDGASFESDPPPFTGAGLYHSKFSLIMDTDLTYRVESTDATGYATEAGRFRARVYTRTINTTHRLLRRSVGLDSCCAHAQRLPEKRDDLSFLRRLNDGYVLSLMRSNQRSVLLQAPPSCLRPTPGDRHLCSVIAAGSRSEEHHRPGSRRQFRDEVVVVGA